jgi:hypothetical protein
VQISLGKVWRYQTCKHNQTIEGQKYNDKRNWVNNDLQNTTQKTKESEKRTQQRHSGEIRCSMRIYSSCSPNDTRRGNRINHIQLKSTLSEYIVSFLIFFHFNWIPCILCVFWSPLYSYVSSDSMCAVDDHVVVICI